MVSEIMESGEGTHLYVCVPDRQRVTVDISTILLIPLES
jgi:hypothetical protein